MRSSEIEPSASRRMVRTSAAALCVTAFLWLPVSDLVAQAGEGDAPRGPLPLEVAVSLREHNGRSPVNLSPDGEWIAHTVATNETVRRGTSYAFADTGFPFAEGDSRMAATLSRVGATEEIRLGDPESSSWAPVWSPDGSRVAFYSDEGGEAGLWVWERASGERRRVSGAVVRPFFGFETVRWAADSRRLLVKLLPTGTTLAEANAFLPAPQTAPPAPVIDPAERSVTVRRTAAAEESRLRDAAETDATDADATAPSSAEGRVRGLFADLAVVDVTTGVVERIVERQQILLYSLSPDERFVAYAIGAGSEPNTQQALFDLILYELATGASTRLADDVRLRYGIEWSWSPDGSRLAYTRSGQMAEGEYVVVSIPGGDVHPLENDAPNFAPGEGEIPPIWSADGAILYGVGGGALWTVDPDTGGAREMARLDGWEMRSLVTASYASPVAWSPEGSDLLWVFARETGGERSGILSVDPVTGETRIRLEEEKSYSHIFSQAASDATGGIVFVSRDLRQPGELHVFHTTLGQVAQASRINAELGAYPLGEGRIIRWTGARGEPLAGALLLPPDYDGSPLPTVVWVYGGEYGSRSIGRFGLWGGATFNMHLLATRGYAVLYPDAPLRSGTITEDLVASVLPGVDAAITQGYADPDRLAIMGQSFGSLNVLALITRTNRFRAAVISAAVLHPDLFAAYLSSTGYYEAGQGNMGGTIWEHADRYRENSPLFDFPRIETPLLIGQGDRDGDLVPSEAIFNALERLGKSVEYRVYQGEGHVITRAANVIDFWERRLAFLAAHLDLLVGADGTVRSSSASPR